ncbi:MAG: putative metal-binding motif-containing protein [Sandaracinaceae bacterium]|nr:putative metal-binding motif-containing protein [Sandaracinaceae bacterium]
MARAAMVMCLWVTACGGGGPTRPPCNLDEDCDAGSFCGSGGCMFECVQDLDCVPLGRRTGDTSRGRCLGGAMDGGAPDGSSIDGATGDSGAPCESDTQCDDGTFCNGVETCLSGACRSGPVPCDPTACNEENERCDDCVVDPDRDGDGEDRLGCGGRDCNDDDIRVTGRPGAEICDSEGLDEDCNPSTLQRTSEDADADGHAPPECCNGDVCGDDCANNPVADPNAMRRFGGNSEVCDGIDNDCDSLIDEMVASSMYWRDADADGFGATGTSPQESCSPIPGWVTNADDCNDANNLVYGGPAGAPESCNNTDDNCNGSVDEGDPGGGGACGSIGTPCQGTNHCSGGTIQCFPARSPSAETCNNFDDDCNGIIDSFNETQTITCSASAVTQQVRACSGGGWSGWTTTSVGTQSCTQCGGRTSGTQSCQTNGSLTSCSAGISGEFTSERCSSFCSGTTWPYGHVSCVSNMVWCTPDVTSGGANVWRIEGNSGVLGHDCGSSYGSSDWYVDHNAVGGNCAAVWFYHGMPPGTYRITYRVYRTGPRGTWPNVLGVDLYHGGDYRFVDYRVPEGAVDLIVDNVRHNTYCAILDLGLVYRGGFWTDSMVLDYVLLERLAP